MPVAIEGRRRLQPEERANLLLKHAVSVFARRGIGRGGHTEIAEVGGVSVATVFNYFKTREALVDAVLAEIERFFFALADDVFSQHSNPKDAIHAYTEAFLEACDQQPDYIKVWLEWSASPREEVWPKYLEFQAKILKIVSEQIEIGIRKGIFKPGLPAEERARWALGNSHMLVCMALSPEGKPAAGMKETIQRGFDHLLSVS